MAATQAGKINKIVARLKERIAEGEYYEAQQQTRVVAARYTKKQDWPAAIDLISGVAQSLLRAGQGGSGGDLAILLVDVYCQAKLKPDAESRDRLLVCLRLFDGAEPTRKKFITEMINWSSKSKCGEYPAGDPELHHIVGSLYAQELSPLDAERHLVLGTKDAPEVLTRMEYSLYKKDEPHTAANYAARAVLPYLLVANVRAANACYRAFTAALREDCVGLMVQDVESAAGEVRVFTSLPLMNFLGLLLLAVQKGSPDAYRELRQRYASQIAEVEVAWEEALEMIGEMYFGIQKPRQSNPLMSMMGSLFGGGGRFDGPSSGGAGPGARRPVTRQVEAPMAEGLD